ncbi:MAG: glycosyltransferase family 4 protein [Christensenellaceae bacterium]|nr:glycosyltransferase family 4 protein [Christensenellaceae bacterium]
MNILFLTIGRMESIGAHSIYADLLRCFCNHGDTIYTISPYEKRTGKETEYVHENGAHLLHIKTGNVTGGANIIEKGFSQMALENIYIRAIKKYFSGVKFDLVMYSTPPITFSKAVDFIRRRDGAKSYLLLKDIFPQNAIDIGMMTNSGVKGMLYKHFRNQEKKLYRFSDYIGCMSQANVDYVVKHNPEVDPKKVEVCPNSVEVLDMSVDKATRLEIRKKYGIPLDKKVFVYGGNLGKPQGIPFLINCLQKQKRDDAYFLIVGEGSEYPKLEEFIDAEKPDNVKLMKRLPKEDYDSMVGACDIGLIFLDHRFTIPNFPSRLLAYMQAKLPVLAVTDPNTDIGKVVVDGGFGWWCESDDTTRFLDCVNGICDSDLGMMKEKEFRYLEEHYSVEEAYRTIMRHL